MEKRIAKSPEVLEREAKIEELNKTLKKRRSVLKSLKTRLGNTQNKIERTQREIQSMLYAQMSKMEQLRREIADTAEKMKHNKHFSKADRQALDEMANEFLNGDIFGEGYAEFQEQFEKAERGEFDFDENMRAKMNDVFQEFRVAPEEKEQRSIRKVFIKLSKKFHPDLASNPKEEAEFHKMQQEINKAYKANDIQKLLEFEQLYLSEELDLSATSVTIDVLQEAIERLERDLKFINNQIDRTSTEIKQLRQSDMGTMLTSITKANRAGEGVDAMKAELDQVIQQLDQINEGLKDSHERGSISPILVRMMNPLAGLMDMMKEEGGEEMEEMVDMLGALFDGDFSAFEDEEEIEDPDFPIDSFVKVKYAMANMYHKRTKMKGWVGKVVGAYYDEEGQEVYDVEMDSETMKKMPFRIVQEAIDEEEDFQEYRFYKHQLEATKGRDTDAERMSVYRSLKIEAEWDGLVEKDDLDVVKDILLNMPAHSDGDNWCNYFEQNLPFEAKGKGHFELKRNKKVTVRKVLGIHDDVGVIVGIQKGRSKRLENYPLVDLMPTDGSPRFRKALELHDIWAEDIL